MKITNSIKIILYLTLVVFLLIQIYEVVYGKELFTNSNIVTNSNIQSLILSPYSEDVENKKYFGSFIKSGINSNIENSVFLYNTNSLESNKWSQSNTIKLDERNNVIVTDLFFDKMRKLIAIGLYFKDGKPIYNIYRKQTDSLNSGWELIGEDTKMRNLCYDMKTSKLLGVSSYDGQIYESKLLNDSYDEWVGPINYDIPMRKIMYNKDDILIGIGLFDNFIYTKESIDWRNSYWSKKNINKTKVYDLIYDTDGCFIAASPKCILKQLNPEMSSEFINIKDYPKNKNREKNLELQTADILKYRIGYEFLDDIFDTSTSLGKHLKNIYDIKKMTKDLCSSKKYLHKDKLDENTDALSFKHREINDLYKQIEKIGYQLSRK